MNLSHYLIRSVRPFLSLYNEVYIHVPCVECGMRFPLKCVSCSAPLVLRLGDDIAPSSRVKDELEGISPPSVKERHQQSESETKCFHLIREVWKIIHRIPHPSHQPLWHDPDELNHHFALTTQRVTSTFPASLESIQNFIKLLSNQGAGSETQRLVQNVLI